MFWKWQPNGEAIKVRDFQRLHWIKCNNFPFLLQTYTTNYITSLLFTCFNFNVEKIYSKLYSNNLDKLTSIVCIGERRTNGMLHDLSLKHCSPILSKLKHLKTPQVLQVSLKLLYFVYFNKLQKKTPMENNSDEISWLNRGRIALELHMSRVQSQDRLVLAAPLLLVPLFFKEASGVIYFTSRIGFKSNYWLNCHFFVLQFQVFDNQNFKSKS